MNNHFYKLKSPLNEKLNLNFKRPCKTFRPVIILILNIFEPVIRQQIFLPSLLVSYHDTHSTNAKHFCASDGKLFNNIQQIRALGALSNTVHLRDP